MRRISSLPRFLACPSSALATEHPYEPPSEAAGLGTAVHEALAAMVGGAQPDVVAIATNHRVDADEVERLYTYGAEAWRRLREHFPNARPEQALQGVAIRGTADVFSFDGVSAAVLDWKTNRVERDYGPQLIGYAAAAAEQYGLPETGYVTTAVCWLRFGEVEVQRVGQADIDGLHDQLQRAEASVGQAYAPGDPCTYCPRQLVCSARHDYIRSAAASLVAVAETPTTCEGLARLYPMSRALKRALESYDGALRLALDAAGELPDGDGGVLGLLDVHRDEIDPVRAWPVLEAAGYTTAELASCTRMGKTSMLAIVGSKAPRGQKQAMRGRLLGALREAGAVKTHTSRQIRRRKGTT